MICKVIEISLLGPRRKFPALMCREYLPDEATSHRFKHTIPKHASSSPSSRTLRLAMAMVLKSISCFSIHSPWDLLMFVWLPKYRVFPPSVLPGCRGSLSEQDINRNLWRPGGSILVLVPYKATKSIALNRLDSGMSCTSHRLRIVVFLWALH